MIDFLKLFIPDQLNRELVIFIITFIFLISSIFTSLDNSKRIQSSLKQESPETIERIIPNLESVCIDNDLMQCLSFEEPHDSKIKVYTNKFLDKKTYTLQITPNTRN